MLPASHPSKSSMLLSYAKVQINGNYLQKLKLCPCVFSQVQVKDLFPLKPRCPIGLDALSGFASLTLRASSKNSLVCLQDMCQNALLGSGPQEQKLFVRFLPYYLRS